MPVKLLLEKMEDFKGNSIKRSFSFFASIFSILFKRTNSKHVRYNCMQFIVFECCLEYNYNNLENGVKHNKINDSINQSINKSLQ